MNNKIKQVIISNKNNTVFLFTKNPAEDIKKINELYVDENYNGVCLGFEKPELFDFKFLGEKYKCISLWFDNEDIPNYYEQYEKN